MSRVALEGRREHVLVALNAIGVALSAYLVAQHYAGEGGGSRLCELGHVVSCSRVLQSDWAVILGVPVAVHGMAYFTIALGCSLLLAFGSKEFRSARDTAVVMLLICIVGVASCAYFVLAELMLGALCPLCTLVHMVVVATLYLSLQAFRERASGWTVGVESVSDLVTSRIAWLLLAATIAIVPIVAFNLPQEQPHFEPTAIAALLVCLQSRGVKMYGAHSCGHCIKQKAQVRHAQKSLCFSKCLT